MAADDLALILLILENYTLILGRLVCTGFGMVLCLTD